MCLMTFSDCLEGVCSVFKQYVSTSRRFLCKEDLGHVATSSKYLQECLLCQATSKSGHKDHSAWLPVLQRFLFLRHLIVSHPLGLLLCLLGSFPLRRKLRCLSFHLLLLPLLPLVSIFLSSAPPDCRLFNVEPSEEISLSETLLLSEIPPRSFACSTTSGSTGSMGGSPFNGRAGIGGAGTGCAGIAGTTGCCAETNGASIIFLASFPKFFEHINLARSCCHSFGARFLPLLS